MTQRRIHTWNARAHARLRFWSAFALLWAVANFAETAETHSHPRVSAQAGCLREISEIASSTGDRAALSEDCPLCNVLAGDGALLRSARYVHRSHELIERPLPPLAAEAPSLIRDWPPASSRAPPARSL
jgi:hypothetical protein